MVKHEINFTAFEIIDWYDGPTCALCKSQEPDEWFFANIVFIDFERRKRIFVLIQLNAAQSAYLFQALLKTVPGQKRSSILLGKTLRDFIQGYDGAVWLFETDNLDKKSKTIISVDRSFLKYFKSLDEVMNQSKKAKKKWLDVFK